MDLKYKKSLSLILIWGSILIEILILSLIKSYIPDFDSIIAVLIHIIFTLVVLISCRNKIKIVFIGAFLARLFFLFWDIYAKSIFTLPNSGADSEKFFNQAVNLSKNLSALINNDSNIYAKIMGFLFYWIGPQRILGQYINVLLGLSIIIIIYKILIILEIRTKIINLIVFLAAFFPNSIIMSSIFLREMFVTFFVASSLYYFIKWYKSGRYIEMLLSIFMLGASSIFHSGVIGIIIGYFFIFLFYDKNNKHFRFRIKTIFTCILIIAIVSTGFVMAGDIILKKFQKVDEISDVYRTANSRLGESIYLINLKIKSTTELIIFSPIKAIYFLISPLPMDWRGAPDIFAFFMDSSLYLIIIIYFLINIKKFGNQKVLIFSLVLITIGVVLIFGVGVSNAGTAIRHRQKLISLFLILFAVMLDGKKSYPSNKIRSKPAQ